MKAESLILTHFSQRYQSCFPIPEHAVKPIVAFDFMKVLFRDIPWAHVITDIIPRVFPDSDDKNEIEVAIENDNSTFSHAADHLETGDLENHCKVSKTKTQSEDRDCKRKRR
jgi:hypothetical protein